MADLQGCKVAVLATDGVEQVELTRPIEALRQAKAEVTVVAPKGQEIQGMNHHDKGDKLPVDKQLSGIRPDQFDALMLPGGSGEPRRAAHHSGSGSICQTLCAGPQADCGDLPRPM